MIIPTNVISQLSKYFPNARIIRIIGSGTTRTRIGTPIRFEYGTIAPRNINKFEIEKTFRGGDECETISEIYKNLTSKHFFLDGTVSQIKTFVELNGFGENYAELTWNKYTPHKGIDLPRIVDGGSFPDQDLYSALQSFKTKIPRDSQKYYKSTVLKLNTVSPKQEWMGKEEFINAIWESPMIKFNTITKNFDIKCAGIKKGGKVV